MRRGNGPLGPDAIRAAKATHLGATIVEAAKRFGVAKAAITRARRERPPGSMPTFAETALGALTNLGVDTSGSLDQLAGVAGWLSYVNKAEETAASVRVILEEHVASGLLEITGDRWTLVRPWP
ncbi:MAG: hypothetical protein ABI867_25870 [Kofleriaceae bacterium]